MGASMMNGTSVSRLRIILTWWETLTVMSDGREEKILMKGTCVFPPGEPVKGTHNIPLWVDVE